MKLMLTNVRLSFPELWTPKSFDGGEPRFKASFLIDPDTAAGKKLVRTVEQAIESVASEKWQRIPKGTPLCLLDGNQKEWDGYADMMYVNSSTAKRPLVIDRDRAPLVEADGKPYAGCYVNAQIDIWAQDNQYGKRVNATLLAIQFVSDGEAFSGGAAADVDAFEVLEDEIDDDAAFGT
jgi:hypothetical protein